MINRQNLFSLNFRVFLVILILISGFFVLQIKPLLADEAITITQDKTLTKDINGSIIIGANDITLDCGGHKIIGFGADNGYGVHLDGKNNITVKNCVIENFYSGIYSDYSTNSVFVKNNISNNGMGIFLICSSGNKISENNIFNNELGLGISNACPASDNLVYHNNFENNQAQSVLDDNSHNDLFDNGYFEGGNYWSDYDTPAKGCNNANGDNFCDASYIFMREGEDRYPFVKENGWKEETPEWRKSILAGDILYDPFTYGVGHVGLYIGDDRVIEAQGSLVLDEYPGKVKNNPIALWDYSKKDTVYLLRVKKPDGLNDTEWNQKITNAIDFAKQQQSPTVKPYDWHWHQKQSSIDSPSWYCSELVWAAYYNQGVDLEYRPDGAVFDLIDPISPVEIFDDEDTIITSSHLEGSDSVPWYREFAPLWVLSPVNVIITDKDGNIIDQSTVEQSGVNIPGATFIENQTDADGHKYSIIYLPVEYGPYEIQVIRKADACDEDVYSLKTQTESGDIWLAQNHPVPADGEKDEYIFDPAALNDNNNDSTAVGFNDTEKSSGNTYQAGTLDFSLNPSEIGEISLDTSIDVSIVQEGTLGFQYRIRTEISGNEKFCGDLEVEATLDGDIIYDGELENFSKSDFIFSVSGDWKFEITDSENNPEGEACDFDFIFEGWQKNIDDYENGGFTDEEIISGTVKSGGEILPPSPKPGDVIINEVMWMGSEDKNDPARDGPKDQWIELKNVSERDLHLKNWYLTYKKESTGNENKLFEIENNRVIKDGEYFLLSHYNKSNSAINVQRDNTKAVSDFDYGKFQIKLYTDSSKAVLIDTAGDGISEPTVGDENNFYSMERNGAPGDGTDYNDWHTCLDQTSTTLYWDNGRTERGTPGAENL